MTLERNVQECVGWQFVCSASRSHCARKKSALADSFFSRSNLQPKTALKCIAGYAAGLSNQQICFYGELNSPNTATNWMNHFRTVCKENVEEQRNNKIGGAGLTVEMDETLLFKRKANTGKLLAAESDAVWMFGGICRETRDAFVVQVPSSDSETLLRYTLENVELNTHVITDGWRGYSLLSKNGYEHSIINHNEHFVDPFNREIHTQTIERMWKSLKKTIPK